MGGLRLQATNIFVRFLFQNGGSCRVSLVRHVRNKVQWLARWRWRKGAQKGALTSKYPKPMYSWRFEKASLHRITYLHTMVYGENVEMYRQIKNLRWEKLHKLSSIFIFPFSHIFNRAGQICLDENGIYLVNNN